MTKREFPRPRRPDWWVIGPIFFNLMLWAVIVWGADALRDRPPMQSGVAIADLRPGELEQR